MALNYLEKSGVSFTGGGAVTTPSELRDRIIRTLIGPFTNAVLRICGAHGSGMSLQSERLMHRLLSGSAPSERARGAGIRAFFGKHLYRLRNTLNGIRPSSSTDAEPAQEYAPHSRSPSSGRAGWCRGIRVHRDRHVQVARIMTSGDARRRAQHDGLDTPSRRPFAQWFAQWQTTLRLVPACPLRHL